MSYSSKDYFRIQERIEQESLSDKLPISKEDCTNLRIELENLEPKEFISKM